MPLLQNVTEIRPVGVEFFHAERQTNGNEASSPFRKLAKTPEKRSYCVRPFHCRKLEIILAFIKFRVVIALSRTLFASV